MHGSICNDKHQLLYKIKGVGGGQEAKGMITIEYHRSRDTARSSAACRQLPSYCTLRLRQ